MSRPNRSRRGWPRGWRPGGLAFNEDKTRIVHLDDGVDFLGFNVRRYRGKLLIKPSKAAVKRIRARLTAEMRALRGHNAQTVLIRLNPIIRGWSAYYRHVVSSEVFNALDYHVWKLTYKWAKLQPSAQVEALDHRPVLRRVQPDQARPVGVRRPRQRRLPAQVRLDEDHPAHAGQGLGVPGRPGPGRATGRPGGDAGDPRWTGPGCGCCNGSAGDARSAASCCCTPTHEPTAPRRMGAVDHSRPARRSATTRSPSTPDPPATADPITVFRLVHTHCRDRPPGGTGSGPALLQPRQIATRACLSRLPGKRARPVLRGPGRSNAPPATRLLGRGHPGRAGRARCIWRTRWG